MIQVQLRTEIREKFCPHTFALKLQKNKRAERMMTTMTMMILTEAEELLTAV